MSFIVKNTTFPSLLDLIAPHSCRGCGLIGSPLCERCKKYILDQHIDFCPKYKSPSSHGHCKTCKNTLLTFVVGERSGLLDVIIHDFKYQSVRSLGPILAELLNYILPNDLPKNTIIVPLPTSTSHIRSRGIDHTLILAKNLAKLRHLKIQQILIRNANTAQVGSNRTTRIKQANSNYALNPRSIIKKDATYLLLDDIWTTGASMQAAIKKLREAGASNIIVALLAVSRLN